MPYQWIVSNYSDPDLVAWNIKSGVNIFGVVWTLSTWLPWVTSPVVNSLSIWYTSCWGARSIMTQTATDIYLINASSWANGTNLYGAWGSVVRYNKSAQTMTDIGDSHSWSYFYTQQPTFWSAYLDGIYVYINFYWYQVNGMVVLNTSTNGLSFSQGSVHTTGTLLTDSISYLWSTIKLMTYPLPFTSTPWYGASGWISVYLSS